MLMQTIIVALTVSHVSSLVFWKAYRARGAFDEIICAAISETKLWAETSGRCTPNTKQIFDKPVKPAHYNL